MAVRMGNIQQADRHDDGAVAKSLHLNVLAKSREAL